jgi:hypothetical protein
MMDEHHTTRRLLNAAAQDLLRADESIRGRGVRIGDETIHSGDEIITRTQNRTATGDNGRFLRNGVAGTVISASDYDGRASVSARFPSYGVSSSIMTGSPNKSGLASLVQWPPPTSSPPTWRKAKHGSRASRGHR